jgi:tRNA U34 5-carboxymethylaminomethyl modifying GTPase MnmE/TrmE
MKTKSPYDLGVIVVFSIVAIATATSLSTIDNTLNAYAQNTTTPTQTATPQPQTNQIADPQQIKNYLNQAIQALDSGNNTKALEQVDLAEDQLEGITGTEDTEDEDEDEEEEGEIEEGAGEDVDEPGDIDTNDEEDTP